MGSLSLVRARDTITRLQQSTKRAREKAGELVESVVTAGEVSGTAFAIGFWEGRIQKPEDFEVFGVPIPLAAGLAAHTFAMLGVGRGMENHLRSVGNGALAAHLNGIGRKLGQRAKIAAPAVAGELPGASMNRQGAGITEEMLRNLA